MKRRDAARHADAKTAKTGGLPIDGLTQAAVGLEIMNARADVSLLAVGGEIFSTGGGTGSVAAGILLQKASICLGVMALPYTAVVLHAMVRHDRVAARQAQ